MTDEKTKDTTLTPEAQAARAEPQTTQEKAAANKIDLQTETNTAQGFATEEGKKAQIEQELKAQQDRSEANEEGQAKVQQRIEEMHKDNKAAEAGDGETTERKVPDNPTSGLEHNRNTPRVDKFGNKHWD